MDTYPHLQLAPEEHNSKEFLDYLRVNNKVVWENPEWIVIENCKYHTIDSPWYTAFWKGDSTDPEQNWYQDIDILWYEFGEYEWVKKAPSKQTIKRFHIHLIPKNDVHLP